MFRHNLNLTETAMSSWTFAAVAVDFLTTLLVFKIFSTMRNRNILWTEQLSVVITRMWWLPQKELNPCDPQTGWSLPLGRRNKHTLHPKAVFSTHLPAINDQTPLTRWINNILKLYILRCKLYSRVYTTLYTIQWSIHYSVYRCLCSSPRYLGRN